MAASIAEGKMHRFTPSFLMSLVLPLMAETALFVAVGIADTMMVSRSGEAAVSGVSCFSSFQNLFIALLAAFSTGGSVVTCQLLGMGDRERAERSAKRLLQLTFLVSSSLSALFLILRRPILSSVFPSVEKDVYTSVMLYAVPIMLSMPFHAVMSSSAAICRSVGRTRITMVVSVFVNIINVAGNALLLFVWPMGALGVGIASLFSRIFGAAVMLVIVSGRKLELRVDKPFVLSIDRKSASLILEHALPSGVEKSLFNLGKILIMSTISSFGTASIAAYAVFNNMETLIDIPGSAMGLSSITVVGRCCGARDYRDASYYMKLLLSASYILMFLTSITCFLSIPYVITFYGLSEEAAAIAIRCIRIDCIARAILWSSAFVAPDMLQGAGDVKLVMVTGVLVMWTCRVLLAHILGVTLGLGLLGTQCGMWCDWLLRVLVFIPRLMGGRWKTKSIAEKEALP